MHYTTRHWVARPGHEAALLAALRQLEDIVASHNPPALYLGQDTAFPGRLVTFTVWHDRAQYDAFNQDPALRQLLEVLRPILDMEASTPPIHLTPPT